MNKYSERPNTEHREFLEREILGIRDFFEVGVIGLREIVYMGEVKAVEEYEKGVILGDKFCDLELCDSGFLGQIIGDLLGGVLRKYDN